MRVQREREEDTGQRGIKRGIEEEGVGKKIYRDMHEVSSPSGKAE